MVKGVDGRRARPAGRRTGPLPALAITGFLLGVPFLVFVYQAHHTGLSVGQMIAHIFKGTRRAESVADSTRPKKGERINFLAPMPIGFPAAGPPKIGSNTIVDLDGDGLPDVLVCDMLANHIGWIRQYPAGTYTEKWVGPSLPAPARAATCDIDGDGDLDILVAVMGQLFPTNDKIGSVVILENDGRQVFAARTIIDRVARVTDVRAADFNGDRRRDLVVGQFGYDDGETRWLENLGGWRFRSHVLQSLSGVIHTIPVDIDSDGDTDFISLVSQEWEEIYLFENDGRGNFRSHLIWGSANEDYGSSGMRVTDMNRDGRMDILFTNGDAFDYLPPRPRPWHSVQWLQNQGNFTFAHHPIGSFEGASGAVAADVDNDGDMDVVAVSCYNFWERAESQSIIWFENDGKMNFTQRDVAHSPTHLINLETADMDGDAKPDFVTVRMDVYAPFSGEGRVVLWLNQWAHRAPGNAR